MAQAILPVLFFFSFFNTKPLLANPLANNCQAYPHYSSWLNVLISNKGEVCEINLADRAMAVWDTGPTGREPAPETWTRKKEYWRALYRKHKRMELAGFGHVLFPGDVILSFGSNTDTHWHFNQGLFPYVVFEKFLTQLEPGFIVVSRDDVEVKISFDIEKRIQYAAVSFQKWLHSLTQDYLRINQDISHTAYQDSLYGIKLQLAQSYSGEYLLMPLLSDPPPPGFIPATHTKREVATVADIGQLAASVDKRLFPCPLCQTEIRPGDIITSINGKRLPSYSGSNWVDSLQQQIQEILAQDGVIRLGYRKRHLPWSIEQTWTYVNTYPENFHNDYQSYFLHLHDFTHEKVVEVRPKRIWHPLFQLELMEKSDQMSQVNHDLDDFVELTNAWTLRAQGLKLPYQTHPVTFFDQGEVWLYNRPDLSHDNLNWMIQKMKSLKSLLTDLQTHLEITSYSCIMGLHNLKGSRLIWKFEAKDYPQRNNICKAKLKKLSDEVYHSLQHEPVAQ